MDDAFLVHAVDSCSSDVISANPYWNFTDQQRKEWRAYSKARLNNNNAQHVESENEDDCDNDDDDDDEETPQTDETEEHVAEKQTPIPAKIDKRKKWVEYQSWARATLKEEHPDRQKFPLTEVNKLARTAWVEDGWGASKK